MAKTMMEFYTAGQIANKVAGRFAWNDEFQLLYNGYKANYTKYDDFDDFEDYMENYLTSYAREQYWKNAKKA